ncbi:CPBP family intramembrane metalloprotease [bacterium]|nr:CPBP family intramembrane metalloprotease [bacterium]
MNQPDPRRGWRISDAVLVILAGLFAAVIAQVAIGAEVATVPAVFGVIVPAQAAGSMAAVAIIGRRRASHVGRSLGLSVRLPDDSVGLLSGAGLQVVLAAAVVLIVDTLLGLDPPEQEIVETAADAVSSLDRVLVVLGAGIIAPIAEEITFRGVLLRALLDRWGGRVAVYGSAVAFAAIHLLDPNAIMAVPVLLVVGVVMGRQVIRTGRIGRAIFTHIGFNMVSVAAILLVG